MEKPFLPWFAYKISKYSLFLTLLLPPAPSPTRPMTMYGAPLHSVGCTRRKRPVSTFGWNDAPRSGYFWIGCLQLITSRNTAVYRYHCHGISMTVCYHWALPDITHPYSLHWLLRSGVRVRLCSANEMIARKTSFSHQTTVDSTSTDILEYNSRSSLLHTSYYCSTCVLLYHIQ